MVVRGATFFHCFWRWALAIPFLLILNRNLCFQATCTHILDYTTPVSYCMSYTTQYELELCLIHGRRVVRVIRCVYMQYRYGPRTGSNTTYRLCKWQGEQDRNRLTRIWQCFMHSVVPHLLPLGASTTYLMLCLCYKCVAHVMAVRDWWNNLHRATSVLSPHE